MDSRDLDRFAQTHLLYEVATLSAQVRELDGRVPDITDLGFYDAISTALGEASLVHLRLLDDFLGLEEKRRHKNDVLAIDWPGSWRQTAFLAKGVREDINARLAHLSNVRSLGFPWDLGSLVTDCCTTLLAFIGSVRADRSAALAPCDEIAREWLGSAPVAAGPWSSS
jgi:hypothetical protein